MTRRPRVDSTPWGQLRDQVSVCVIRRTCGPGSCPAAAVAWALPLLVSLILAPAGRAADETVRPKHGEDQRAVVERAWREFLAVPKWLYVMTDRRETLTKIERGFKQLAARYDLQVLYALARRVDARAERSPGAAWSGRRWNMYVLGQYLFDLPSDPDDRGGYSFPWSLGDDGEWHLTEIMRMGSYPEVPAFGHLRCLEARYGRRPGVGPERQKAPNAPACRSSVRSVPN